MGWVGRRFRFLRIYHVVLCVLLLLGLKDRRKRKKRKRTRRRFRARESFKFKPSVLLLPFFTSIFTNISLMLELVFPPQLRLTLTLRETEREREGQKKIFSVFVHVTRQTPFRNDREIQVAPQPPRPPSLSLSFPYLSLSYPLVSSLPRYFKARSR